jgi:RNA polymerase sigma factor (TIGR02999 family)
MSPHQELDNWSTALYSELKRIAANQLKLEKSGHTLQPTALVHEVYLRLAQCDADMGQRSRAHFLATAATLMRQILVNHARTRNAQKRGGGALKVTLHEHSAVSDDGAFEVLTLDTALGELHQSEPRKSRIIELKFFGGMTEDEIAEALEISKSTVTRETRLGLALLYRLLQP